MTVKEPPIPLTRSARPAAPQRGRWAWQQWLALLSVPLLIWQTWTIVAWLAHGPHQITQYRDRSTAAWAAARIFEPLMVVIALVLLVYVVRGCIRERRLTFDAMLCITGLSMAWLDPFEMFFQPVFLYSSNWTNLSSWCSYIPFVINVDCSRIPEPLPFLPLIYTFGVLGCTMLAGVLIRRVRARRPNISFLAMLSIVAVFGVLFDIALEYPMMVMHLWNYPGFPDAFSLIGGGHRLPLGEVIGAALFWGGLSMLRNWKDDRGRTFLERGMEHVTSSRRRTVIQLFALITIGQLTLLAADWECAVWGLYSSPYVGLPAHVVNSVCDAGGFTNTRYGPCPGSPGYRIPLRDLPGSVP